MSEIKNDEVIGEVWLHNNQVLVKVKTENLTPEDREYWEVGKRASGADVGSLLQEAGRHIGILLANAYAAGLASAEQRIAELERELEIARALQPPAPEPEIRTGSTADLAAVSQVATLLDATADAYLPAYREDANCLRSLAWRLRKATAAQPKPRVEDLGKINVLKGRMIDKRTLPDGEGKP
jgi:hypothetical protein